MIDLDQHTLSITIVVLLTITVILLAFDRWQTWRTQHPKVTPSGRTAECETCGTTVGGKDWWSLITIPAEVEGEQTFGGGTAMVADYCTKHRPLLADDRSTLQRHG